MGVSWDLTASKWEKHLRETYLEVGSRVEHNIAFFLCFAVFISRPLCIISFFRLLFLFIWLRW